MTKSLRLSVAVLAGVSLLLVTLVGCPGSQNQDPNNAAGGAKLVRFSSPSALLSYFKEQATARVNASRNYGGLIDLAAGAPTSDNASTAGAEDGTQSGDAYSTTNLQEAGVDESDVFKSDGTYFYVAKDTTLRIIRAKPADQMAELAALDLGMRIDSLYLYGTTVIALGTQYSDNGPASPELMIWPPYYQSSTLAISQVDVTDPTNPSLTAQMTLDGNLVSSRLVNNRLLVVLTVVPNLPANPTPLTVGLMTLDQVMPKMRLSGVEQDVIPWDQWLRPESPDGYYMTGVVTLDAANVTSVVASAAVLANAGTIYASTQALYVTDADYDPQDNYREKTNIHKFAIGDDGAARYVASGSIPGRLLNQFSLGEFEAHLRVATHVSNFDMFPVGIGVAVAAGGNAGSAVADQPVGSADVVTSVPISQPYNGVYVLAQSGDTLEVTGFVDGLAPGETLYAARFIGDHGFLVTYRKIDPLFILNLANPAAPAVVGELKVPGFSEYLHPLDDTHLIGVGKATYVTEQGFDWFQGVQISLFDVSDWANPRAVQQLTFGGRGSESDVLSNHKAFTFLPESNLLALPMQLTTQNAIPWEYGQAAFNGVIVLRVDAATGFTELGRIDNVADTQPMDTYFPGWWYGVWHRAAFINNTAYSVTPAGVRAAPTTDFTATHELDLTD